MDQKALSIVSVMLLVKTFSEEVPTSVPSVVTPGVLLELTKSDE